MSRVVELRRSRRVPQVAVLAVISIGFAGCSADTTRFADNPFTDSSYSSRPPETTGSLSAPVSRVESRPLPQYQSQSQYQSSPLPPPTMPANNYPGRYGAATSGTSGGGRGVAAYTPPARPIETTGTVAPRSVAAAHNWNRENGTTIIVGTSDTLDSLSRRYGVPPHEILRANNISTARALQPGQQLVIPRYKAQGQTTATLAPGPAPLAVPPPSRQVAAAAPMAPAAGGVHIVNPGDSLMSIARRNHIGVAQLAGANHLAPNSPLRIGQRLTVPGAKVAAAQVAAPAPVAAAPAVAPAPKQVAALQPAAAPAPVATAPAQPVQKARMATETTEVEAAAKPDATGGLPTFRWPVRGRVITAYGAKTSGKTNDGINVAVPEGTPVKAAEDGVVTYAGNELKGYGNLVLVRHPNGYVTAYAHASELMVKRGESIKRGQVIAKSGQTGEVGSPQLHFEIRKGSTPVDPTQFLSGA